MPRRHATEFIHGSRRQRALERSEPVGLMWIGHDRLLFSDSRARDASGPGRGYLHTAASRPLQLARRQAGLQVIRALLVPGTRPNSRMDGVRCLSWPERAVLARSRGGPAPEPARRLSLLAPRPAAATAALPAALHRRLHCSLRLWSVAADGRQPLCGWRTSTEAAAAASTTRSRRAARSSAAPQGRAAQLRCSAETHRWDSQAARARRLLGA